MRSTPFDYGKRLLKYRLSLGSNRMELSETFHVPIIAANGGYFNEMKMNECCRVKSILTKGDERQAYIRADGLQDPST